MSRNAVLAVYAASVLVRMLALFAQHDPISRNRDAREYHLLGQNLAAHGVLSMAEQPPFAPCGFREPIYPALIAGVYRITGPNPMAAAVFLAMINAWGSVAAVALCGLLARRADTRFLAAAWAFCTIVPLVTCSRHIYWSNLLREEMVVAVSLVAVWLAARVVPGNASAAKWLPLGICCAAGVLVKCTFAAVPTAIFLATFFALPLRRWLIGATVVGVCIAATSLPWMMRNKALFGRMTWSCSSGVSLYVNSGDPSRLEGVQPIARRVAHNRATRWPNVPRAGVHKSGLDTAPGWMAFCMGLRNDVAESAGVSEELADGRLLDVMLEDIRRDPDRYASFVARYLAYYATGGFYELRRLPEAYTRQRRVPVAVYYDWVQPSLTVLFQLLVLAGAWRLRREPMAWALVIAAFLTMFLHCLAVDAESRYRVMFDELLAVVAFAELYSRLFRRSAE